MGLGIQFLRLMAYNHEHRRATVALLAIVLLRFSSGSGRRGNLRAIALFEEDAHENLSGAALPFLVMVGRRGLRLATWLVHTGRAGRACPGTQFGRNSPRFSGAAHRKRS